MTAPVAQGPYENAVLADGPLIWWPLSGYIRDSSGNGNHFTPFSGVRYQQTPLCSDGGYSAKSATGTDNGICYLNGVPSGLTGASVTLECWVNIPGSSHGTFAGVGTTANGWSFGIGSTTLDNDGLQLILANQGVAWVTTGYTFSTGTHHVMVVRSSGNSFTAYVDGSSVWTGSFTPSAATTRTYVGGYTGNHPISRSFNIDNVAFFASALSSARVTAHYNSGSGSVSAVVADSPTIFLKFDDDGTWADTWTDHTRGTNWIDPITNFPSAGAQTGMPAGMPGGCQFTASSYGQTNNTTTLVTPSGEGLSVELWVKTTNTNDKMLIAQDTGGGTTGRNWSFQIGATGILAFNVFTGTTGATTWGAVTSATVNDGNWHHVVGTWDNNVGTKVYIDSVLRATSSNPGGATRYRNSEIIMLNKGDNVATGYGGIDATYAQVAIYAATLTQTQVTTHYNAAQRSGWVGWGLPLNA